MFETDSTVPKISTGTRVIGCRPYSNATLSAINNGFVNVFNGNAHRPILSINDLGRSILCIIQSEEDKRGIYNIASFNEKIYNIGEGIASLFNVELRDTGNNFTYDFSISSQKFIDAYNFAFSGTIKNIAGEIANNQFNNKWNKREKKNEL